MSNRVPPNNPSSVNNPAAAGPAGSPSGSSREEVPRAALTAVTNVTKQLDEIKNQFQEFRDKFGNGTGKSQDQLQEILKDLEALDGRVTGAEESYTAKFQDLDARAQAISMNINAGNKFANANSLAMKAPKLKRLEEKVLAAEAAVATLKDDIGKLIEKLKTRIGE